MLRISGDALGYRCESSGRCCQGWPIGFDRAAAEALPGLLAGIPRYAGRALLAEGFPGSAIHYRLAACDERERCIFLNEDNRCDLHARFGPQAKSLVGRQYPFLAVKTPLATTVALTYSCPSAARRLLDPGPFQVLADPPSPPEMAMVREVPAQYPLQVEAGVPLDWEGLEAAEAGLLGLLAGEGDPSEALGQARARLEGLAGRPPGPLQTPRREERARLASEAVRLAVGRAREGRPWTEDRRKLEALAAFEREGGWDAVAEAWSQAPAGAWTALRRYLAAKCFGNILFITYGLIPAFQALLLLGLLARLEAARRAHGEGRPVAPGEVAAAAEVVDRLFPHESGLFAFWDRKGGALDSLVVPVSAALILAGAPRSA